MIICKILGQPIFQERTQYTQITTMNMYLIIEIRHNILNNVMGIMMSLKKIWLSWGVIFEDLGVQMTPTTPCWLRLYCRLKKAKSVPEPNLHLAPIYIL